MKNWSLLLLAAFTVGCGSSSDRDFFYQGNQYVYGGNGGGYIPNPESGGESSGSGNPSQEDLEDMAEAVIPVSVSAVGYSSTKSFEVTVSTKDILKVRFVPGIAESAVQGSGYIPTYSKMGVYIAVEEYETPTEFLSNGIVGQLEQSRIIDLSNKFTKTCAANDSGCRQDVKIIIRKPNYNYWCYIWGQCPPFYNEWTHVHYTHNWTGTLYIETNDTEALE